MKLSPMMNRALVAFYDGGGHATWWALGQWKVGDVLVRSATVRALIRRGHVEIVVHRQGSETARLTDAGIEAATIAMSEARTRVARAEAEEEPLELAGPPANLFDDDVNGVPDWGRSG